jgi:serine/threonine protein kinase/tetratricopeptide (TPR) repeat protein
MRTAMDPQRAAQAQQIFGQAIERPTAERSAHIAGACGDDDELRQEVESLIASMDEAGGFLSAPTGHGQPDAAAPTVASTPLVEHPGSRIGRYKLLQLIGEGGFGSVFMAEQEHPVRRKVAIKIIKLGMDTKQVIARFEAERQALAMMDHPNIARVLDAGATDTGQPYFVMELVRGVPITQYCDENKLTADERLDLLTQVCQAVQHAHQKGIIHRDIKPSNVLVTMHDDRPVPKVIDFGIAKATNARLTERTLFTEYRQFIGTPQYTSPEQAQMSGLDVDTRSDVYSLGVLLYELLTGTTPFDPKELRSAGYDQMQRMIREVEPPKPSTRLTTLGETLTSVAALRSTDPRRLAHLMRGELDWIVMKCLEKDRTRRYETPSALAADLRRHLEDEPVQARPVSVAYWLSKLLRRHKAGFAAASIAVLGLTLGLAAALFGLVHATHDRDLAVTARLNEAAQRQAAVAAMKVAEQQHLAAKHSAEEAQASADQMRAVNRFLQDMLSAAQPDRALGKPVLVRDVVDQAARKLDAGALNDQPEVQAAVRETLGQVYFSLGDYALAEAHLRKAMDLLNQHSAGQTDLTAAVLADLANAVGWRGDRVAAERFAREALALQKKLHGERSVEAAYAMEVLAVDLHYLDRPREAEPLVREALEIRRREHPESHEIALDLALLGYLLHKEDPAASERLLREGLTMLSKVAGRDNPDVASTLHGLAIMLSSEGRPEEADAALSEAVAIQRKVLGPDHSDSGSALGLLAQWLYEQQKWSELRPVLLDHYAWALKWRPDTPDVEDAARLLQIDRKLANAKELPESQARLALEVDKVDKRIAVLRQTVQAHPDRAGPVEDLAAFEARFGHFAESADDYAKAIKLDPGRHWNWYYRGCLLAYLNDVSGYRAVCHGMLERFAGAADPSILDRTAKTCLLLPGDPSPPGSPNPLDLAARALRQAGDDANLKAWFSLGYGMALYRRGDFQAATEPLQAALTPPDATRHPMATLFLAMADHRLGREHDARQQLAEATRELDQNLPNATDGDLDGVGVENWLMCQVARREAEALIAPRSATTLP